MSLIDSVTHYKYPDCPPLVQSPLTSPPRKRDNLSFPNGSTSFKDEPGCPPYTPRFRNASIIARPSIGIIGLGYVGLPLARAFAQNGFRVLGFDIDPAKVSKLMAGQSYIQQIPVDNIREMRENGFEATDRFDRLGEPDAILICVPTPLTEAREPDLAYVVNSAQAISAQLRQGQLVVLESTTYPSTTRNVVLPILEASSLNAGRDFFLAFSPEREDPGNATHCVSTIPKVVGGLDAASTRIGSGPLRRGRHQRRARFDA